MLILYESICDDVIERGTLLQYCTCIWCPFVSSVTRKIAQYLGETLEDHSDKLQGNLQVNGGLFTCIYYSC